MSKSRIEKYIDNDLILTRFKDKEDLKEQLNEFFNNENIEPFSGQWLKVKAIENKSYYDNNFQDYEIMVTVGTNAEDIYDITIYYAKTRTNENIIVETNFEEV